MCWFSSKEVFDFDINYKGIFPSLRCSFKGMVLDMFFVLFLYYPFCTNIWGICSDFYPRRGFSGNWRVGIPNTPGGDVYTNVTIFGCGVFVLKKSGHQFRVRSKKKANDCMVICAGNFSSLRWCHETFMTPIKSKPVSIGGLVSLRPS